MITFGSYSEAFGSAVATPVSFTVNQPGGALPGDLMLIIGACRNANDMTVTNASFTTINLNSTGGAFVAYRIITNADPGVYNISLTSTSATSYSYVAAGATFRGVDSTTPIDVVGPFNTTNANNAGVTTTMDNCVVVGTANALVNAGNQYTFASPFTNEIIDLGNGGASNRGVNVAAAYYTKATAGATGTLVMPANGNFVFALRPGAAGRIAPVFTNYYERMRRR